ncbi:hypothetical protein RUM44_006946 [Polyplax serrata]|uniref:Uncharacterized protein n=1 Tax=Polyplax serrata TaxID=468196 RepID=A0ABR1AZC0_POLSC
MNQSEILEAISILVQLPGSVGTKTDHLEHLHKNVKKATEILPHCSNIIENVKKNTIINQFVTISLNVLEILSQLCNDDSSSSLLSVQQQQKIKILLQMIFSLGVAPGLLKGVNTPLKNKTVQLYLHNLEEMKLIESYKLMTKVVRTLIPILSVPSLRALIIAHLGDLISVLLQVNNAGTLKKPVSNSLDGAEASKDKKFVMTEETYGKLIRDRNEFKETYQKLVENLYKPLVIKELLVLLAPTKAIESGEVTDPPPWLKRAISQQLTSYLISPGGVSLVMRAVCESSSDNVDWSKVDVLAKLISTVHGNLSDEEFYAKIGPQVISLLSMTGSYCIPVAKNCIRRIHQQNSTTCNRYIFQPLFDVFIMCSKPVAKNFKGTLISEDSLSKCIDHLTKCFAPGSKESSVPIAVLIKIVKIIYKLYMKVAKSPYQHKSAIQDLLTDFLNSQKDTRKLAKIYNALIFQEPHEEMLDMNEDLEFQFGPSGGVQVGKRQLDEEPAFPGREFQLEYETIGDHTLDLLSEARDHSKKLLSDLFVILLSALSDFHDHKIEMADTNPGILSVDELLVFLMRISQKRIITIKLLAVLAENDKVTETIQEKPEIVFQFVKNLLASKAKDILHGDKDRSGSQEEEDPLEDSTREDAEDLFVALAVVDLMTVNVKTNSDRWDTCKALLPSLETIKDNCQDENVKYYSELLFNRISTRGAVSGAKKPQIRPFSGEKVSSNAKRMVGGTPENVDDRKTRGQSKVKEKKKLIVELEEKENEKSELNVLLEEVKSEDVPTRGHAIIELAKYIRRKDERTMEKKEYVFSLLKCNLRHEDSYVYLSAINSLEAFAAVQNPEKILELLCEEYTEHKKDDTEIQSKIGEVLMRITRNLGDVAPKYKALLINTFLFGVKSTDEFLRVSSLSNLGELVRILRCSVGSVLQEVFACVKAIVTTDKSVMARRAAVMVIQFLLKGITTDTFMILEYVIRDLFRALIHVYKTDRDDVTRLHAQLALDEINRLVRPSLEGSTKLEKHIGILGLPR